MNQILAFVASAVEVVGQKHCRILAFVAYVVEVVGQTRYRILAFVVPTKVVVVAAAVGRTQQTRPH